MTTSNGQQDGARALMRTLVASGVTTLFTNPGTTELHLVEAAEATPGLRSVLALFEGVVSGAADGYGRIAGRPAATLLHLGPGQGNAWANFHNARRAHTPIVSLIGDHATYHKRFDPPLESDIAAVAAALDSAVRTPLIAEQVSSCAASAVADAVSAPGRISTIIMPADVSWSPTETLAAPVAPSPPGIVPEERIERIAAQLGAGPTTALLLGGPACREDGLVAASRIATATGIRVFAETFPSRIERGAGLPAFPRLGFYPQQTAAQLEGVRHVLVAGAHEPVALFFAYRNQPSSPVPADAETVTLADVHEDAARALTDLAAIVAPTSAARPAPVARPAMPSGPLNLKSWPQVVGALLPENSIIVDESISSGLGLGPATAGAPRHDLLSLTGGAMGIGLPLAAGAAIAAPDRPVILLDGDGCAMYTISALWTHAREQLDITTIILKNGSYGILREEWELLKEPGQNELHDSPLINLGGATLDFVALAQAMGVPAAHADTAEQLAAHLTRALSEPGPHLIEAIVPCIT
jgi:acetolactate synthase I/II/III large subunit